MADGTPSSRTRRTARLGGLVAGQGARVAGGRVLDRARGEEARERAQRKRTAAVVEQIVVQLGQMKGAAMKLGQVLSTIDLPGLEAEDSERIKTRLAELRDDAPRVPFARLEKLMAAEWGEPSVVCWPTSIPKPWRPPRSARSIAPAPARGSTSP